MKAVNFGSLNIDHVYAVAHFCRAGETIHTQNYTRNAGGKGLNQSIAVARSGQKYITRDFSARKARRLQSCLPAAASICAI